jgi:enoyl-CoA hydratase
LDLEIPVIAAINGAAIGAGLCVASACDIRIAAQEAKLGFTFTRIGLHPGMGATYFLPRVVGAAVARELLLTGRVVEAGEALRIGLVSKVVPANDVLSAAVTIAKEILECGPLCTRQLLQSLRTPLHTPSEALQREALCQAVNYAGSEFAEGINAIREKRRAKF